MKKIGTVCGIILGTVFMLCSLNACKEKPNQEDSQEDSQEVAEDQNEAVFDEAEAAEDDAQYLVDVTAINLMEIKIGELAQLKGVNDEVKKFGKMMVEEHNKSATAVKELAASKNVSLPTKITEDGQEEFDKLYEKTGADFDKKFAEIMVNGHQKAINLLRKASEDANSPEIRSWATNQIPILTTHLEHAQTLKNTVDK